MSKGWRQIQEYTSVTQRVRRLGNLKKVWTKKVGGYIGEE